MQARPFLMFEGKAEQAMTFHVSFFPDGQLLKLERFGPDGPGGSDKAGTVLRGLIRVAAALADGGQALMPQDNYGFSRLFTWQSGATGCPGAICPEVPRPLAH